MNLEACKIEQNDWKRFRSKLNCAIVGFAGVSWGLSQDLKIARYCLVAEAWFIFFVLFGIIGSKYSLKLQPGKLANIQAKIKGFRVEWQSIFSWLMLAGATFYIFIIRGEQIIIRDYTVEESFVRWEIVALAWNVLFSALSFLYTPKIEKPWCVKLVFGLCLTSGALAWFALSALMQGHDGAHLARVLGVTACYIVTDLIIGWQCPGERKRCVQMFFYADLPTAGALAVLWLFWRQNSSIENIGIFLSGAIAFQFIASSIILAVIEGRSSETHSPEADSRAATMAATV